MKLFSQLLLNWYHQNNRDLPWRTTSDPYLIWISEIILQQTRVIQGLDYYNRFVQKWPTVADLAEASEQDVLKMWQGLGYYSRARNLLSTAKTITEIYKGVFPQSAAMLQNLKGIGKYTSAAIASNAFNEKVAAVDGNVLRFVTRFRGIDTPIDSNSCKKSVQNFVDEMIDEQNPGIFNQAMMEFGALYCTPNQPGCEICPFSQECEAYKHNLVNQLPVKKQKTVVRTRYFNYLVFIVSEADQDYVYLQKRIGNDIWKGLYEFPLIETTEAVRFEDVRNNVDFPLENSFTLIRESHNIKHQLTHQTIFANFFIIKLVERLKNPGLSLSLVSKENLWTHPLSRLIDRYLQQNKIF